MWDKLTEHEAFLRAIFDAPADDTPRLVYADFLEENDNAERAELIRVQSQRARGLGDCLDVEQTVLSARDSVDAALDKFERGFRTDSIITIYPEQLNNPEELRREIVRFHPHWFGAKQFVIASGRMLFPEHVAVLFELPALSQIVEWNFSGGVEEIAAGPQVDAAGTYSLLDIEIRPVITQAGLEALCKHRKARRLLGLDLRYNNLGNDAARALINSPHLINLERLDLLDGNRLRGQTWQQLCKRWPNLAG